MAPPVPLGPEFIVAAKTNSLSSEPRVAVLRDGRSVAVWDDTSAPRDVRHRLYDYDGTALTGEVITPANPSGRQTRPDVAALAGGGFVIVWREIDGAVSGDEFGNIRFAVFAADGTRLAEGFAPASQTGFQDEPAVIGTADGGFVIGWTDRNGAATGLADGTDTVMFRKFAANGTPETAPLRLSGEVGGDRSPALAAFGNVVAAVWDDNLGADGTAPAAQGIYRRILTVTPTAPFADGGTKVDGTGSARAPILPDVALAIDGTAFTVWESGARVFLRRGDGAIQEVGSAGVNQRWPKIAALKEIGGVAVVWFEERFATTAQDVYLRVYDAAGNPTSAPVLVKAGAATDNNPDVIGLIDGRILVVWGDAEGGIGTGSNVRGRIYDPRPAPMAWTGQAWGERFWGTEFAAGDTLDGGGGDDLVNGRGGADVLAGGAGNDTLIGGPGNDTLLGGPGNDTLWGGAGDDSLNGGPGNDRIDGGDGLDIALYTDETQPIRVDFTITAGANVTVGGVPADTLVAIEGVIGGGGNDTLFGDAWSNLLDGGAGDDSLRGFDGADTLRGGAGRDTIEGDAGNDRLEGGDGDDFLFGGAGNNTLEGGAGRDTVEGGPGNDRLAGGADDDQLQGSDGADTIDGGTGNDMIYGGDTAADLRDVLFGGDGNDTVYGGAGNDEASGGTGDDILFGDAGADTLIGNDGRDTINGGALADVLFGGPGDDFLNGGFGFDRLNGGAGADTFFHLGVADHGSDWIQDYNAAEGDILQPGIAGAVRGQFQVNISTTPGAGSAGVAEAFVIYRPTGQILWALVDGAGQTAINLRLGGEVFDLLA